MKVGIDVSSIVYGRGVSRYTANLVEALLQEQTQIALFGSSFRQYSLLQHYVTTLSELHESIDSKILRLPPSVLTQTWKFFRRPTITSLLPTIDIFHSWDWIQPPEDSIPFVSTVHDVAILKYPNTAHPKIVAMHHESWKRLKKRKARIIAVSRTTKQDLIEYLDYPQYLIDVVHEALPKDFVHAAATMTEETYEQIKIELQLNKPYILFVGTQEPRKNLGRLIQAWQTLAKDFDLRIVGDKGWGEAKETYTFSPIYMGRVSDKKLSVLYAEASAFVYPSLYEGFGLPILESFYHGTPVITSNLSGMREVAGNAAQLISPESTESILEGIQIILNENLEAQRNRLQRMMIRLQMFSWEKVAKETIAVYRKAIEDYT